MKKELWRGVMALAVLSLPALAKTGVSFSHKDWEVVCDNTLTCRAAGYSAEEGSGGSVLLTRQAGAGTAVSGELMLAEVTDSDVLPGKLTLWINGQPAGDVKPAKRAGRCRRNRPGRSLTPSKAAGRSNLQAGRRRLSFPAKALTRYC